MSLIRLSEQEISGYRVLVRSDFNVPIESGVIQSAAKLEAALPTIQYAVSKSKGVLLMSHLGRPKPGLFDPKFSLAPVADWFSRAFNRPVRLVSDYLSSNVQLSKGEIVVLENVRFNKGETENAADLARKYAELCDLFVMDAFGCAHREHASTSKICEYVTLACSGFLLEKELQNLDKVLRDPVRPLVAVLGGVKLETKWPVFEKLAQICDGVILGGGLLNTFLKGQGRSVGSSLYEEAFLDRTQALSLSCKIPSILDVVVKSGISNHVKTKALSEISHEETIFDVGPKTLKEFRELIGLAKTVIWNGPIGKFEDPLFRRGTTELAVSMVQSGAYTVAGGGETLEAIEWLGLSNGFSFLSTGGGAFLSYLSGKPLPALEALESV